MITNNQRLKFIPALRAAQEEHATDAAIEVLSDLPEDASLGEPETADSRPFTGRRESRL